MNEHLARAIKFLGSQEAVANVCGKSQQDVGYWLHKGTQVPPQYSPDIVAAVEAKAEALGVHPPDVTLEGLSPRFPWDKVSKAA